MFPPAPALLGFSGDEARGWSATIRGRTIHFRLLRTLPELAHAEALQEEVFGVTERDLIPANELIVIPETGGAVIAAFLPEMPERAVGVLVGWGGFVGRPRIVSDLLAVRPEARNFGLAEQMKRLQAAIALQRGFQEIVWTVDPLRAANARLNFGKLRAVAREYEIDRYGSTFAAQLYGGLPTDRLHVTWEIATPRVIAFLTGDAAPTPADRSSLPNYVPGAAVDTTMLAIPADVDALFATDPAEALRWRMRVREALTQAFGEGFAVTGFIVASSGENPTLLLQRDIEKDALPQHQPSVRG
jgi:predicted GNAT superfamily acetyltransferase